MDNLNEKAEQTNRELWDEIAPVHFKAYKEVDILRRGGIALDELELAEIGDVTGKTLLHLQCHIGSDTLSWARQGALVTGVDFSAESLTYARKLAQELDLQATFVQSNLYDLRAALDGKFDIVYTSRGVLCWLRDLDEWARIIAYFLKTGGVFYIMESHPITYIFEEKQPGELAIFNRFFHQPQPTLWDEPYPDYADGDYIPRNFSYEWEWSLGDIFNALIKAGLVIESFNEYERIFFKRFQGMVEGPEGWYTMPQYADKLPLIFTLKASKLGG